jgi:NTE family protein
LSLSGILKYLFADKLFSSENFEDFISKEIGGLYYEDLPIPLACVSADIKTGEKVIFDSGPVALGVRASMNLPGIFAPVEYRQRFLVDGGVVDYMPVDLVKEMGADWVLAVYALPDYSRTVPSTILGYVVRIGDIRGAVLTEESEKNANFLLGVRVGDINFTKPSQAVKAVEIGSQTTYLELNEIKENLLLFSIGYVYK